MAQSPKNCPIWSHCLLKCRLMKSRQVFPAIAGIYFWGKNRFEVNFSVKLDSGNLPRKRGEWKEKKISKQQLIPKFDFKFECQMTFCFNLPIWRTKFFLTWAKICTGWISTVVFFLNVGQTQPLFVYFRPFSIQWLI